MKTWPVQDAKARFSEFLEACIVDGPQMVSKRGVEAAVLVPVQEWRRLQAAARPSLKQLLLSDAVHYTHL
jgi:antitoxin Phd